MTHLFDLLLFNLIVKLLFAFKVNLKALAIFQKLLFQLLHEYVLPFLCV